MKNIKGRYKIEEKLGEGGMGVVFRAYDPPPMDRQVALKTLHEFADRSMLDLFYKECSVLKSISHPNIVEIFDMGEFEDEGGSKPFFVMPLLRGQTLDVLIKNSSHRLTVDRVVQIITQTCRGLQAAHDHGLVHRDLKPSNLFVISDDSVKIIDFGVAHVVDSRSQTVGMKGTLLYMAPEQFQNKPVTPQSDIFSLGVVCYEALTRRLPFRGGTQDQVIQAVQTHIPPPASDINPAVSQAISRAVHKAMAKQPWNRYDSAREFGETLQKALHNLPIELFDPSRTQPRIDRAARALENGDYQFAGEIIGELESGGHVDPQIGALRAQLDQMVRRRTIAQLLESARARYEEDEDPLALQKLQEILEVDPGNVQALGLKSKVEARRSDRQIQKWVRLAEEHIANHSYAHARDALQNVLTLRPKDSRAQQLVKDLEEQEQEYLHLRAEKAQIYQSALNAWKNGDVSEALSHMRLVMELDGRAPDHTSPDIGASYQGFFNKVQSEHDAISNSYAEARRRLAASDFARALEICREYLEKYPGQALFQALKFDIEEQQRQQLSAFIADVNRRLEAESDLNAKVNLLREAVEAYPGEPHFERSLKLMIDKRDLVSSIVLRAQVHEERGQINEAISDFETLRSIYPSYQGLKFEIERLERRREQQNRDAAKANWVRQIDRVREAGNHARALELIERALADFPDDAEFIELQNFARQGLERSKRAEDLLAEGQRLCAAHDFDKGLEVLGQAHELDERNTLVLTALHEGLIERARLQLKTDWRAADALLATALELEPDSQAGKSLRAQVLAARRDEEVMQCASQTRRLQAAGELAKAEAEVRRGLELYPSDPRLTAILDTLQHELTQSTRKRARIEQLREEQQKSGGRIDTDRPSAVPPTMAVVRGMDSVDADAPTVLEPIRQDQDAETMAVTRPVFPTTPPVSPPPKPVTPAAVPAASKEPAAARKAPMTAELKSRVALIGGLAALLIVVGIGVVVWQRSGGGPEIPPTPQLALRIRTSPPGAAISVDGKPLGTSDVTLQLEPGDHLVEATLPGYAAASQKVAGGAETPPLLELSLQPLRPSVRLVMSGVEVSEVRLDETVGKPDAGSLTLVVASDGEHLLRFVPAKPMTQEAKIEFTTAVGALPTISKVEAPELQVIAVTSMAAEARVTSSVTGAVVVDGESKGNVAAEGLLISGLTQGPHELTIGEGADLRKIGFTVGPAPSLDAVFFSDRDVGSILVVTQQNDVVVIVDDKTYGRKTANGQVRLINMSIQPHRIRVHKDGFLAPEEQIADVKKGQESVLQFELVPVQRLATLLVRQLTPGAQVFVGDRSLGTMPQSGTLSAADIQPGSHEIRFVLDGYRSKSVKREFVAGGTVTLSGSDVELVRASAFLEVDVEPTVSVTVRKADGSQTDPFTGPKKLDLAEGRYTVEGTTRDGRKASQEVQVTAGASMPPVRLTFPTDKKIDRFDPKLWEVNGTWYKRISTSNPRFALYKETPPGLFQFAFTVPGRTLGLFGGSVKWVTGFRNDRNYILFELDRGGLARTVVIDGKRTELSKIPHKIPWDREFVHISIEITADRLKHSYKLDGESWQTLHDWNRNDPELVKRAPVASFAAGQFGFDGEIQISDNFLMRPQ
jgi:serine/threonine-protein kinase